MLHDLEKLSHMVAGYDPALLTVFPQATEKQKECFDLLRLCWFSGNWTTTLSRRAYVEARYNPRYRITERQLEYLASRVKVLQRLTKKICQVRMESYASP
jgi:hypothetical protein